MLYCYFKYNVWTNQYKKEKLYVLSEEARKNICQVYQSKNTKRDQWVKNFFDNYKFLNKWSSFKYERSARLQAKRRAAYKKQYGLGENCFIGYGVIFHKHHYVDARIQTGNNCLIAEETNIDYTGGVVMGNKVSISEGVKILTHNHSTGLEEKGLDKGCIKTPLVIHDRVWIGTRAIIMPGVREIGRGAIISADSYVHTKVPPYSIVLGNPAKVVGFRMPLDDILEYEKANYEEKERIPVDVLSNNYDKYYRSRWKEVKQWCKI
jgi:maltose O-acetyltransferase